MRGLPRLSVSRLAAALAPLLASSSLALAAEAGPTLELAGPPELVVSADDMRCEKERPRAIDVTDMPPTAYRRSDGTVMFLAGNSQNIVFQGPSLDEVSRDGCESILPPVRDPDPEDYRDKEWVFALYSVDGETVLGFVHNEFHGENHGYEPCDVSDPGDRECWYASTTLIRSLDGGRTFARPPAPDSVLLSPPSEFRPGQPRVAVSSPKVVGNRSDGRAYVLSSFADRTRDIRIGQCLVRGSGASLEDWEMWDGEAFVPYDASAYDGGDPSDCAQVLPGNIFSVKYLPAQEVYVALGLRRDEVYTVHSRDLVTWSRPRTLMEIAGKREGGESDRPPTWYYSLLDPTSGSRNFDTLEDRPYLYFVQYRTDEDGRLVNSRRDVMRIPLKIR